MNACFFPNIHMMSETTRKTLIRFLLWLSFPLSQEENEGACPTSAAGSPTCPTPHLQKHCTWWRRDIRHGRQGEHAEAHCGFTANPTTGISDLCNWGWQVRGQKGHTSTHLLWLYHSLSSVFILQPNCFPHGCCVIWLQHVHQSIHIYRKSINMKILVIA